MIAIFAPLDSALKKSSPIDLNALPENAVWIDLDKPTAEEDRAVERLAGIAVPTREDMREIEISSRLYTENGARYMTASLMCAADTESPRITPVTFILANHRLVTVCAMTRRSRSCWWSTSWRGARCPAPLARPCCWNCSMR
jgi:magnesium transporter